MDLCKASTGVERRDAYNQIVTAYSEPHRYYHNLGHIDAMLMDLREVLFFGQPQEEFNSIRLAIWYHDVVYEPHSSENESRSAEVAARSLESLGVDNLLIRRVCELILMTKDHLELGQMLDTLLFLDLDLSILGSEPSRYQTYADAIRKEYAWVDDRAYCAGRRIVLQRFLERPFIFRSEWFEHLEPAAHRNINNEIVEIDAKLRALA